MSGLHPMPSPNDTNYAGKFLPASWSNEPTMAMDAAMFRTSAEATAYRIKHYGTSAYRRAPYGKDAAPSPDAIKQILRFVLPKLSPQDFAQVRGLLMVGEDPMVKGPELNSDLGNNKRVPWSSPDDKLEGSSYGLDARFPGIECGNVDPYSGVMKALPATRRPVSMSAAQLESFHKRFPGA
jgi:hypothetical protein